MLAAQLGQGRAPCRTDPRDALRDRRRRSRAGPRSRRAPSRAAARASASGDSRSGGLPAGMKRTSASRSACSISNAVRMCPKWIGSKVPPKIPIGIMRPGVLPRYAPRAPRARATDRPASAPFAMRSTRDRRRGCRASIGGPATAAAAPRAAPAGGSPRPARRGTPRRCERVRRKAQRHAGQRAQIGEQRPQQQRRLLPLGAQTREDPAARGWHRPRTRRWRARRRRNARCRRPATPLRPRRASRRAQASAIRSISCCAASRLPSTRSARSRAAGASSVTPRSARRAAIQRGSSSRPTGRVTTSTAARSKACTQAACSALRSSSPLTSSSVSAWWALGELGQRAGRGGIERARQPELDQPAIAEQRQVRCAGS